MKHVKASILAIALAAPFVAAQAAEKEHVCLRAADNLRRIMLARLLADMPIEAALREFKGLESSVAVIYDVQIVKDGGNYDRLEHAINKETARCIRDEHKK